MCFAKMTSSAQMLVTRDGGTLFVRHFGNPKHPVLLVLHQEWQHGEMTLPFLSEVLKAGYHVVIPDLRGHGLSLKPLQPEAYTLRHFVDDLSILLAHVSLHQVTLCAPSAGLGIHLLDAYFQQVGTAPMIQVVLTPAVPRFQPAHLLSALACHPDSVQGTFQALKACVDPAVGTDAAFWQAFASSTLVPPTAAMALVQIMLYPVSMQTWPIQPQLVEPPNLVRWLHDHPITVS